ncbi:MAG: N-acetyltransferase [Chloroflexi bacterium]|nr:N-acetyltransferase [Chloroflexota bacterium]
MKVIQNQQQKRFEIQIDSHTAELTYYQNGNAIIFTHTGVPPALEGQGIASLLVKTGLQYARDNNLKVQPLCWFVSRYIDRHPEFQNLVG